MIKRDRKTFKEKFVDMLARLADGEDKAINNNTLRNALGWDGERYQRIRDKLILDGQIYATRGGPGGAVCLTLAPADAMPTPIRVFISYSHQDEEIKNELLKHLSPLRRFGKITEWHDRKLEAGDKWDEAISQNLVSSEIVIIIISIDFINSEYCYVKELDAALARAEGKEAVIIPVIARSCMWKETKFGIFQALPTDGKAITTWSTRDEPLSIVAEGVRQVAERLLSERVASD